MAQILAEWTPSGKEEPSRVCREHPHVPVVLDFGSQCTRIGLASSSKPAHAFPTLAARFRDRKSGQQQGFVGNDVLLDAAARQAARSPFDGPLLTNWDSAEQVLDYAFELVRYQGKAPLAVSEPLFAPLLPHKTMQELLFEGYSVPSLAFGADVLGSACTALKLAPTEPDCLVIQLGNEATTVLPVINGKPQFELAKRINFGGKHVREYMHSLLVLKYPTFPSPVTANEVDQIVKQNCFFAQEYKQFARTVMDPATLIKVERVIQAAVPETLNVNTQERELQQLKRQESGKRLQIQAQAARAQRLAETSAELQRLREFESRVLHTENETLIDAEFEAREMQFDSLKSVQKEIKKLSNYLKRARGEPIDDPVPDTSLLEVADAELSAEQLQLKRRQKLLKASYDARQRAKAAKAAELEKAQEREKQDADWRKSDLKSWSDARKQQLRKVLLAIQEREKLRTDSKHRFKQSLELVVGAKKPKLADGVELDELDDELDDLDDSKRDLDAEAAKLKGELLEHDPEFDLAEFEPRRDWRDSTVHKFLYGNHPFDAENVAQQYQLNLSIERARVVEPLFDPSMVGLDQAGLTETCLYALKQFPQLSRNIRLSGGMANVPGLAERLNTDLERSLPCGTRISVSKSDEPELDAWRGIASWASNKQAYVSRKEYEESGAEYIKDHQWGNPVL